MAYDLPTIGDDNGRQFEGKAALVNAFRVDPFLSNESYSSSAKVMLTRSGSKLPLGKLNPDPTRIKRPQVCPLALWPLTPRLDDDGQSDELEDSPTPLHRASLPLGFEVFDL
jgi:hypothetical protein